MTQKVRRITERRQTLRNPRNKELPKINLYIVGEFFNVPRPENIPYSAVATQCTNHSCAFTISVAPFHKKPLTFTHANTHTHNRSYWILHIIYSLFPKKWYSQNLYIYICSNSMCLISYQSGINALSDCTIFDTVCRTQWAIFVMYQSAWILDLFAS